MSTFTCTRLSTTCNQKAPMITQGNIAPDFTPETDRSEKVTLSKLRGRQVVLFLPEGRHTRKEDRVQGQMMKAGRSLGPGRFMVLTRLPHDTGAAVPSSTPARQPPA